MKFLLTFIFLFCSLISFASERTGIGVSIGNPTGLNLKRWLNSENSVDGGLGLSIGKHTELGIHSDYLWNKESYFYLDDTYPLDLYFGLGGRMEFSDSMELGVRLPVGVAWVKEDQTSDIFFEVAPIWDFISRTGLELHFMVGSRYYFN